MRGDKLVPKPEHHKAARGLSRLLFPLFKVFEKGFAVTIGGESGSGKTELAIALSQVLEQQDVSTLILQQDDYFVYPPRTNAKMRKRNIGHVGPSEVRLNLLDQHLAQFHQGTKQIIKPLVIYQDNLITTETVNLEGIDVLIVEGTYTTLLKNADARIFIDRSFLQTKADRLKRAREAQDEHLDRILEIEHRIIAGHKETADIIVGAGYEVSAVKEINPVSAGSKCEAATCRKEVVRGSKGYVRGCARHSRMTYSHERRENA